LLTLVALAGTDSRSAITFIAPAAAQEASWQFTVTAEIKTFCHIMAASASAIATGRPAARCSAGTPIAISISIYTPGKDSGGYSNLAVTARSQPSLNLFGPCGADDDVARTARITVERACF
jgi:hypothetical protein